jgi:fatty-acyl-CoA synthase
MNGSSLLDAFAVRTAPLHLWQGRSDVTSWSAGDLREAARRWAVELRSSGAEAGSLVATSAPTSLQLIAALLGAWQCGAAVVVLPEATAGDAAAQRRLADALESLRPAILWVDEMVPGVAPIGTTVVGSLSRGPAATANGAADSWPRVDPDSLALVQLTSGSTGRARAVPISHGQLAANCAAMAARLQVAPGDHGLSWLPLTHDMGFSGALAQALYADLPLTLLPTSLFASNPLAFLQAMSEQRATLSPNPPSAYALLARLGRRAQREGLDLSAWRFAWAGAEPVFPHVLRSFEQAMQPLGLKPAVLQPAYGMAEAVVAVSLGPAGRPWRTLRVEASALREQGVVLPVVPSEEAVGSEAVELVSNGAPLDGTQVQVRDDAGHSLPPGRLGTLWVQGPSVAHRYVHGEEPHRFVDGWYDTGDQGFLWDGEVYVTGRVKDIIARGGLKVGAHEIEAAAEAALDLRPGRVAAFAHLNHNLGREVLVLVVARRFGVDEPQLQRRVADAVLRHCGVAIDTFVFTAAGPLPRTTSGKLQRGLVREYWLGGGYADSEREADSDTTASTAAPTHKHSSTPST